MDQDIGHGWVVSGQFNYVNTIHLERNRDYNLPLPTLRPADGRFIFTRSNRPLPQFGQITLRESSARSMYRGGTFSIRNNTIKRFQFGAQYTLAQAFDDDSNERDATCCRYDNANNFKAEYGYSSRALQHVEEQRLLRALTTGAASTSTSKKKSKQGRV